MEITGGERRGGSRGHSHGDGRRRRSEAEEESGAAGVLLENLLLSHFVLGRVGVRGGEDDHRGGERTTRYMWGGPLLIRRLVTAAPVVLVPGSSPSVHVPFLAP